MVPIISYNSFITEAGMVSVFTTFIPELSPSFGPEQLLDKYFKMLSEWTPQLNILNVPSPIFILKNEIEIP